MTMLTALILYVYGIVGWTLFGDEDPEHWGDIGEAMLTLFVLLTLENFPAYLERGMAIEPWSVVYFVSFVMVAAFIVLNLLIGVVLQLHGGGARDPRPRGAARARTRAVGGGDGAPGSPGQAARRARRARGRAATPRRAPCWGTSPLGGVGLTFWTRRESTSCRTTGQSRRHANHCWPAQLFGVVCVSSWLLQS